MSEFQIEKGISIPKKTSGGKSKYPWREMEIGDSFLVPVANGTASKTVLQRLSGCIFNQKPKRFSTRTLPDGVRVWRIE